MVLTTYQVIFLHPLNDGVGAGVKALLFVAVDGFKDIDSAVFAFFDARLIKAIYAPNYALSEYFCLRLGVAVLLMRFALGVRSPALGDAIRQ